MRNAVFLKLLIIIVLYGIPPALRAQGVYTYSITTTGEECARGVAVLDIKGTDEKDSVAITWSSGERDIKQALNLKGGDYSVQVKIKRKKDTLVLRTDTVLHFSVGKEECVVLVGKYFTPNDDNYNDFLSINNVANYPNFEFYVYNKLGQRVHAQKGEYVPWDGKWLGADLPDGTYYYVFFYDAGNRKKLEKGDLTILR